MMEGRWTDLLGCLFFFGLLALGAGLGIYTWRMGPRTSEPEASVSRLDRILHGLWRTFCAVLAGLLILAFLVLLPDFISLRNEPFNSRAQATGYNARIAEEVIFQNTGGENGGHYTNDLAELLQLDKNLTDDPAVTFIFGVCNQSGYTFTTTHAKGDTQYLTTD